MRRLGAACVALLLCASHVVAATISAEGELRYELYGYPDGDRRGDAIENFVEGQVRVRGTLAAALSYRMEGRVVADDAHYTAGFFDPRMTERRRP